jgi:hypothetical protein
MATSSIAMMSSRVKGFLGIEGIANVLKMLLRTCLMHAPSGPSKGDLKFADVVKKATAAANLSTTETEAERCASCTR